MQHMSEACDPSPPAAERLWLTIDATPLHGSTALFLLIAGSERATTICSAGRWQCELWTRSLNISLSAQSLAASWLSQLAAHSAYWDMRRPVLLSKWAPFDVPNPSEFQQPASLHAIMHREGLQPADAAATMRGLARNLPLELQQAGVSTVRTAVLLMHRPWCLWPLSTSATSARKRNLSAWALEELAAVEALAQRLAWHRAASRPVLTLDYAELLLRPEAVEERVLAFAPCLHELNRSAPGMPGSAHGPRPDSADPNRLALHTGSERFSPSNLEGMRARLRNLGYNASLRGQGRGGCVHPVRQVYAGLDEAQMQRAARAEELLLLDAHRRAAARQGSSTVGLPSKAV